MHMHLDDIAEWLRVVECQYMVLIHVSRRTDMQYARKRVTEIAGAKHADRILCLMDYKGNKARYESQLIAAGEPVPGKDGPSGSSGAPSSRSGGRPPRGR
jgi:hypothetical protein